MDHLLLVCAPSELDATFPAWRPALAARGAVRRTHPFNNRPMLVPTWDPTPDASFPPEALGALDDIPGELVTWSPSALDTLAVAFTRDAAVHRRPLLVGPHGREVYDVGPVVVDGLLGLAEPVATFAQRLARLQFALAQARERGEALDLPLDEHLDLPLAELEAETFRVSELVDEGQGSRAGWERRFAVWETALADLVRAARAALPGEGVFSVVWHDAPGDDDEPLAAWGAPPGSSPERLRFALERSTQPRIQEAHYRALEDAFAGEPDLNVDRHPLVTYVWASSSGHVRAWFTRVTEERWSACLDGVERVEGPLGEVAARAKEPRPPLEPQHRRALEEAFGAFPATELFYDEVSFTAAAGSDGEQRMACFIRRGDSWLLRLHDEDHHGALDELVAKAVAAWPALAQGARQGK